MSPIAPRAPSTATRLALVGNPNAGKTTLFNALTGLRAKTANFPGTTVEHQVGRARAGARDLEVIDLPGLYDLNGTGLEERVAREALLGEGAHPGRPDLAVVVLDATNLPRTLCLAGAVLELGVPTIVALNRMDRARGAGIAIDLAALRRELGVDVVPISARSGEGLPELRRAIERALDAREGTAPASCGGCKGCGHAQRFDWAEGIANRVARTPEDLGASSDRLDRALTHPLSGLLVFAAVMTGLFYSIFAWAEAPMTWVEDGVAALQGALAPLLTGWAEDATWLARAAIFAGTAVIALASLRLAEAWSPRVRLLVAASAALACAALPSADLASVAIEGVLGGVGSVLVFLPQICLLFFLLALLEDSGYLARAAFVMDRYLSKVGLPGKAFVPMLSAHACAIPAILSARVIENRRDRLATIFVLPLLTCSARLPVYAMIAALLFPAEPLQAALLFTGAYALGLLAALLTAFLLRLGVLPGRTEPLLIELPAYKVPSLKNAALIVLERAKQFLGKAGGVILLLSLGLWAATTYPRLDPTALPANDRAALADLEARAAAASDDGVREELEGQRATLEGRLQVAGSLAGRVGGAIQPLFAPLGFDVEITVGVLASFAAREVLVSTLAILYGAGEDAAEDALSLRETLGRQVRDDGKPVFDLPTALALLIFFVLAMQCLPTQVVTRRETGSLGWAVGQWVWMTALAWSAGALTHVLATALLVS
ncbi:MAG: ferrous iron transporter B [Planctomycetes bacterium]|nr:ferrous iron transporter B [Planctomycetota bacterium]